MEPQRLQKLIARAGLASRRQAEEWLRQGRVSVNGTTAGLGDRADPASDRITVDGRPLVEAAAPLTLMLHKPTAVISSCRDPGGRPTVMDLLPPAWRRGRGLHPVGRLDADSRGLLLLSNDGDLTLRLTHPRHGHRKTYRVWVEGHPDAACLKRWRDGVVLDGRRTLPLDLERLEQRRSATLLELRMGEGRNRQIRRTADLLGHPVLDLLRTGIGRLQLGDLPEGRCRPLRPGEWPLLFAGPEGRGEI
ncbi:rRNA pseudouridine synthase [Synechococcus sp. RSCCF101]|uniref:pseudouridine synthase n=1 Tax=Synechococcus sp. RSCCF101 TaxID=2511069 RepID=UPI0012444CF7|nr:pseudouridine synthase [Synechococcus sp. RSCCF101]QEY31133.1 rRNA pseudouridine synthase [Synechococcus sp. RSCCF101]